MEVGNGTDSYLQKEIVYQSPNDLANATVVGVVQNWNARSNTISVTNIAGEFVDGHVIVGETSNARHLLTTFDPLKDSTRNEIYDNKHIFEEANTIIDFSEINPFGPI